MSVIRDGRHGQPLQQQSASYLYAPSSAFDGASAAPARLASVALWSKGPGGGIAHALPSRPSAPDVDIVLLVYEHAQDSHEAVVEEDGLMGSAKWGVIRGLGAGDARTSERPDRTLERLERL